jgi:hypothetical protein
MKPEAPVTHYIPYCVAIMIATAALEYSMGRLPFCKCGTIALWSGNIWSNQNSQQLADPYTFSHILHGVLFYGVLWLALGKRASAGIRLVLAVLFESGWELLENSSFIIERYRAATISLDYYGDSIFNSMSDIVAMALGFELARRLPVRVCVIGAIVVDLFLLWWIRDNLTTNIIMLIHPIEAIKQWQLIR